MENGNFVKKPENDLLKIQAFGQENLKKLDDEYKKLTDAKTYNVGLESDVYGLQQNLIQKYSRS